MTTHNIENLAVWNESKLLVTLVEDITNHFPKDDQIGLSDQMRQSSVLISNNIAEGAGSNTQNIKLKFYTIAYNSLMDVLNQCIIAVDLGFLSQTTFNKELKPVIHKLSLQLYALKNNPEKK